MTIRPAILGWAAIPAVVLGVNTWALRHGHHTMSHTYRCAFTAHPALVGAATAYLLAHLTGGCPPRYDLLRRIR